MVDLELAIEKAEEAVRLIPANHPDRPVVPKNFGDMLEGRYERTGQSAALQEVIQLKCHGILSVFSSIYQRAGYSNVGCCLVSTIPQAEYASTEGIQSALTQHLDSATVLIVVQALLEDSYMVLCLIKG